MDDTGRVPGSQLGFWAGPLAALGLWLLWRPDVQAVAARVSGGDALEPATLAAVAGIVLWMAIWWMTEAVAIAVTSLLPLVLLPWLVGTPFDLQRVASNYANWRVYLFFGGFLIAIAMESSGLHRRMALLIVRAIGTSPRRIVLGFMVATATLSMWISNTATALMMLPIGMAVIDRFEGRKHFAVALMLGIAYGASIGGVATPIGTPPNISFQGIYARLYPQAPVVGFGQWMAFALPLVLLLLPLAWLLLVARVRSDAGDSGTLLEEEILRLGPASAAERRVLVIFLATAVLWVFRRPIPIGGFQIPGWEALVPVEGLNDGVVAMTMGLLLFLIPGAVQGRNLLRWRDVERKMPWGILVLFGGGFALADAVASSGLSTWIGSQFQALAGKPAILLIAGGAGGLTFLTEFTSNTATAEIMLPLVAAVATGSAGVHPLTLMLPVTVATSFAFMLPVATPPNAVVFGSGAVPMGEMVRHGLMLNLIAIVLLTLVATFLAPLVFGYDPRVVPDWAS